MFYYLVGTFEIIYISVVLHTYYAFYKVQIFYHLRDIKVAIMPSGNPFKFAEAV